MRGAQITSVNRACEATMTTTAIQPTLGQPQAEADEFVAFGITGDLAKQMTFRSLYRLDQRGLLHCPIIGVAVDDWTNAQLVERARESIAAAGDEIDPQIFDRF